MLNTNGDILDEFLVRGNITTTSGFYTDTIIQSWLRTAHDFAVGFHKWPFTEGRISTTYSTATTNDMGDVVLPYPEGWKSDSIRLLQVGGKRLEKITLEDYQLFREAKSEADDRVFSDFGLEYYINPRADVSGTVTAWGQYTPSIDPTDRAGTTVFSNVGNEGNEAIVNEMLSYANTKEKKANEATYYHQKAMESLEGIWKRYGDEQYQYKTYNNRGMFERIDIIRGSPLDDIKRNQFNI